MFAKFYYITVFIIKVMIFVIFSVFGSNASHVGWDAVLDFWWGGTQGGEAPQLICQTL